MLHLPPLSRRIPGFRVGLLCIACSRLPAEQLTLAVNASVGANCHATISAPALQDAIEAQLRVAGFPLAKAHNATLASDLDCVPVKSRAQSPRSVIRQCLALSQAVSLPSEVRTALATTWQKCQSYTCAGKDCEMSALGAASDLAGVFIGEQRERSAREIKAVAGAVASIDRSAAAGDTRASDLNFFYYAFYITTCIAVLFRWQWTRFGH